MERVKLLSMTAVITVLIWAAADSLVSETATIMVTFEIVPATADSAMLIEVDQASSSCGIEVLGPRKVVEAVQAQAPLSARLRIQDQPTGLATISLEKEFLKRELSEQFHEFRKLSVASVRPSTTIVNVDRLITAQVDITLKKLSLLYEVEPQLKKSSITVQLRESRYKERMSASQPMSLDISAEVDRLFRDQPAGQSVIIPVTLDSREFGPDSVFKPDTILVSAAVKAERSTAEIPTVPILVAVNFPNLEKPYRLVTRDDKPIDLIARTITVTGPTEDVARLMRGDTRAYGIIRLKDEDFQDPGVIKFVTPEYHLPPGLKLAEDPEPVVFKLIDISSNEVEGP